MATLAAQSVDVRGVSILRDRPARVQRPQVQVGLGATDVYGNPIVVSLSAVSAALSAYHGYKRDNSVGWAALWGVAGWLVPIITPAIAFAQGFGQPAR
jgi:hypothetical protein